MPLLNYLVILTETDDSYFFSFLLFFVGNMVALVALIVYLVRYNSWCKSHKRPLNEDEIKRLSEKRKKREIKRLNGFVCSFSKESYAKNVSFDPKGSFMTCNFDSRTFPSYIASQLHGKKHEWQILGLVHEGKVVLVWANKGIRDSVSLSISFRSIISACLKNNCTAILDLHNHPNSNPSRETTLVASNLDVSTSRMLSEEAAKYGISYISFVCSVGNWIVYHRNYSKTLQCEPECVKIDYIRKQNSVSEEQNLKLHKELGLFHK